MAVWLIDLRISLALEKCLHPKKPLEADKGDGCAASRIKFFLQIKSFFCFAWFPHSIKIIFPLAWIKDTTLLVNNSQPILEWDPGFPSTTDKEVFNNITPCSAQSDKSPLLFEIAKSFSISRKIFLKDGGNLWFLPTEKAKPFAVFGEW